MKYPSATEVEKLVKEAAMIPNIHEAESVIRNLLTKATHQQKELWLNTKSKIRRLSEYRDLIATMHSELN